jgi:8-oxo-dGTP diphosphatase
MTKSPKTEAERPRLAVDCVVFDSGDRLLLIRRKNPPFQGQYALPGGFVEYGETAEQAAARELREETHVTPTKLSLIGVYSDPRRDPRGHIVSLAYLASVGAHQVQAGGDADQAAFVAKWRDEKLAFDHSKIVSDARALLSSRR